ncbi:MAG: RNA methyltransferase [Pseudobdellovibrio sp.]
MKRKAPLAVALMHYPTRDRVGDLCATNITNFDIHDIARACRVYGIDRYYLIHPVPEQLMFVERVLDHWNVGEGSKFNPMRKTALRDVRTAANLTEAMKDWGYENAKTVVTSARTVEGQHPYSFKSFKEALETEDQPYFLLFGTGFGLTRDFIQSCYGILEPIKGASPDDYRHLSVRSAVSICLDRLLGS